jgi:hypothetical protein
MRAIRLGLPLVGLSLLVACGGSTPPPPKPPPEQAAPAPPPPPPPSASAEEPEASASAEPEEPPEPAKPPEPQKPKSTATIAGTSISDIDGKDVVTAVQKLKWAPPTVAIGGGTVGKYESIRFGIQTGSASGYIEIIRPAHNPIPGSASMMPPKDQEPMKAKMGATYLDKDADVLVTVVVQGNKTAAKRLLDKLVKK